MKKLLKVVKIGVGGYAILNTIGLVYIAIGTLCESLYNEPYRVNESPVDRDVKIINESTEKIKRYFKR